MIDSGGPENIVHVLLSVVALVLYSTAVNSMCGHQTFWNFRTVLYRLRHYTRYLLSPASNRKLSNIKGCIDIPPSKHKGVSLNVLNQDVLSEIMLCLDIRDASACCCVNRSFSAVAHTPYIRVAMLSRLLYGPLVMYKDVAVTMLSRQPAFLLAFLDILYALPRLSVQKLGDGWVLIDNTLYNLLEFAAEHPGGEEILREYWGKDATRVYHLALHSRFARDLGRRYIVWTPPRSVRLLLKGYCCSVVFDSASCAESVGGTPMQS